MKCNGFVPDLAMLMYLEKARLALRITTHAFDDEIKDIIMAGWQEIKTRGVIMNENDPMIIRAIMTYVRMHFGDPENPERLRESYETQLGQLMTTTGYTEWGNV